MKGAIAAMVAAAREVPRAAGTLGFIITGDEEGPARFGTLALIERIEAMGLTPDLCLVGEPTSVNRLGDTVKIAHVDQSRDALPDSATLYEAISGGQETLKLGNREVNARAYCAQFGFTGADQQKKVGILSGGERNRVHLAIILKTGANLILLDEPTNDLDVNSIRALEEAFENFAGCAVIVSHDRWFLDRVATHIIAFEGDSYVHSFPGNYSGYLEDFRRRKGKDADQPHRIKYRKLTR